MLIHFNARKLRNIPRIVIAALAAMLIFTPFYADASTYVQHITVYEISVTNTWDEDSDPQAVDVYMSYSGTFRLYFNTSFGEITDSTFPDTIAIYYGGEYCGTAVKSGPVSGSENALIYDFDVSVPFHFSTYDAATKSETIELDATEFTFAFGDYELAFDGHRYYDSGYIIWESDMVEDLDAIENSQLSLSSDSGTEYGFTYTHTRSSVTVPLGTGGDTLTTNTVAFTATSSEPPEGMLALTAQKTVNSGTPDQSYTFCLLDADGNVLQTKQNDTDGTVQFDAIEYGASDIGTGHTYQVVEQAGSEEGTTYDNSVYTVTVTPYLDPDDSTVIIVEPTITKDGTEVSAITFNNTVEEIVPTGALALTAQKTVNNGTPDQSYTFYLLDADGNTLQIKQNDSDGTIQFDAISYDAGDIGTTYTYQVKEVAGSDDGTTYDTSIYTVTVTPYLDPDDSSVIIADPTITKDGTEVSAITFNNTVDTAGQNVDVPKTGDFSAPAVWGVAIAVAAAGLFVGLRKRDQE